MRTGRLPCSSALRPRRPTCLGTPSRKREAKRVDLIVANDVGQPGAGFEVETNIASFVTAEGVQSFPLEAKTALAARIVAFIAAAPRAVRPPPSRLAAGPSRTTIGRRAND